MKNRTPITGHHGIAAETAVPVSDLSPLELLAEMVDPDPCWFDHHGYCQAHGYFETDPKCKHARAKDLLREHGMFPAESDG